MQGVRWFATGLAVGIVLTAGLLYAGTASGLVRAPAPETCLLGYPNSSNPLVFEATGNGAWELCDNLTSPLRQINALKDARAIAANTWATHRLCQFDKYGMSWTIWSAGGSLNYNPCGAV